MMLDTTTWEESGPPGPAEGQTVCGFNGVRKSVKDETCSILGHELCMPKMQLVLLLAGESLGSPDTLLSASLPFLILCALR